MLQIKNISKTYKTGDLVQVALDNVSLNLRDNEFVAILGPSGSGKTTLLNIIGGLDRYDDGDLVINNVSTKKYKKSTIAFMREILNHYQIKNNLDEYLPSLSEYKYPRMEEIYEITRVSWGVWEFNNNCCFG